MAHMLHFLRMCLPREHVVHGVEVPRDASPDLVVDGRHSAFSRTKESVLVRASFLILWIAAMLRRKRSAHDARVHPIHFPAMSLHWPPFRSARWCLSAHTSTPLMGCDLPILLRLSQNACLASASLNAVGANAATNLMAFRFNLSSQTALPFFDALSSVAATAAN